MSAWIIFCGIKSLIFRDIVAIFELLVIADVKENCEDMDFVESNGY